MLVGSRGGDGFSSTSGLAYLFSWNTTTGTATPVGDAIARPGLWRVIKGLWFICHHEVLIAPSFASIDHDYQAAK